MRELRRLAGAALLAPLLACGGGSHPLPPPPTPPPPPPPDVNMLLRPCPDQPNLFCDLSGHHIKLQGAQPCCMTFTPGGVPTSTGWPVAMSPAWREYVHSKVGPGISILFHARFGPWFASATAEDNWIGTGGPYVVVGGKADLTRFNEAFWAVSREWGEAVCRAGDHLEADQFDRWWNKQNCDDRPHPSCAKWNVQGYDMQSHVGRTAVQPGSYEDLWIKNLVANLGPLPCVIWQDGNEVGLGGYSPEWTISLRDRTRYWEHEVGGDIVHMFGTNSGNDEAQASVDYVTLHQDRPVSAPIMGKPTRNSEYNPDPAYTPEQMIGYLCQAQAAGTYFDFWRNIQTQAQMDATLRLFGQGCGTPPPASCVPAADDSAWGAPVAPAQRPSQMTAAVEAAKASVGERCGQPEAASLEAVAQALAAAGHPARAWPDAVAVRAPDGLYEEQHVVAFTDGCWTATPYKAAWPYTGTDPCASTSGCGQPLPSHGGHFKLKWYNQGHTVGDATWLVGPDVAYCSAVGYTDGRANCPVRPECGGPGCQFQDADACNLYSLGGLPQWFSDGAVTVRPGNPFLADLDSGTYLEVCAPNGTGCARVER